MKRRRRKNKFSLFLLSRIPWRLKFSPAYVQDSFIQGYWARAKDGECPSVTTLEKKEERVSHKDSPSIRYE